MPRYFSRSWLFFCLWFCWWKTGRVKKRWQRRTTLCIH